jgi:hypothetical protein
MVSSEKSRSIHCKGDPGVLLGDDVEKLLDALSSRLMLSATTTSENVWLRWLLADFGISCEAATPLLCDNTGAI